MNKYCCLVGTVLLFTVFSCTTKKSISPRINHVMLYVSDLDASIDFYTKAFDLHVTNRISQLETTKPDGSVLVRDIEIVFLKFPGQDFVYELAQNPNPPDTISMACLFQHVGVDVANIEEALEQVITAGGKLIAPIQLVGTKDIKVKQAFLQGPDGENIELMQMLSGEF